ncbi:BTB/POZ domain-containing protein At5g48130 isoform X2 [Salvia miltiorrhiza]|nr:BTB/POZ domain-containing protein At5g48130 isoform X2 [Salvia miltiorrhiza]
MAALLMYGYGALVETANVAALRCAAEFLEMPIHCQGLDMYLNQVVLQSWKETVTVLQSCRGTLLPWAEDVLLVTRCIETLAFMACMEILDPERRPGQALQLQLQACWPWSDAVVGDVMSRDVWMRDVVALPVAFFKRVIASLRRQGMKEKYVSTIILLYAHRYSSSSSALADLLPERGSRVIPVGFYLSLLAASGGLRNESVEKKIASMLHLAQPRDLAGIELSVVERIFMDSDTSSPAVAQLWDCYLTQIAADPHLPCTTFIALIQTVIPHSSRHTHDYLYAALNVFFHSHPSLSQDEKASLCKYLDCHKLSLPVCIEAIRNEVMPLRLMVQALFVQHLHTNDHDYDYESTSFRIENLEKELMSLKRTLHLQQRINHHKSVPASCIPSLSFASHRKYANRILRRLTLFGGGRSKRNTPAST